MTSIAIIGSGHTAIAATKRLIDRGCRPVILDVGETLDPSRRQIVERLSQQPRPVWEAADVEEITRNPTVAQRRPKRLAFGSDYVYASQRAMAPIEGWETGPSPTFARGGFSMVWGAAMLPADDCDIADWPIRGADLAPYYRQVLRDLPLSAANDALSRGFPLYSAAPQSINVAPEIQTLLNSLSSSPSLSGRDDVLFGQARVAVRATRDPKGEGCVYCGLCLSGCVYGAIWTADQELTPLESTGQIDYRPGRVVRRLEERENKVEVTCDTTGGEHEKLVFDRVFLAAGAISSTRIVLESKRWFNRSVSMKSTQGYVLPMLRLRAAPISWPNTNTLAAAFLEFKIPGVSDHWVHTQINPANELVMARLDFQPGRGRWRDRMLKPAFKRMLVALCSFHSDHAGAHMLTLRPTTDARPGTLVIETPPSDVFHRFARRAARRMCRLLIRAGVVPLLPLIQGTYDKPWGWHFGGTLPMSLRPKSDLDTDVLGRPMGWSRVHVVDSSVFPSIPGTTVALLAMANAQRIVDLAPLD
jgi:choline dehydrogenase-like flavoprotein